MPNKNGIPNRGIKTWEIAPFIIIFKGEKIMNKLCKIINSQFTWILEVDGESISFNGGYNADYFEKHYKELGYEVKRINMNSTFGYDE